MFHPLGFNGGLLSTARGIEHSRLKQSCKDWVHEKEKVNKHTKREGVDKKYI